MPKSGYINILDFKNPKHLAKYLLNLSQDSTAYNSYFKWKKYVKFNSAPMHIFCNMCIKLHLEDYFGYEEKVLKDAGDYWNSAKQCHVANLGF